MVWAAVWYYKTRWGRLMGLACTSKGFQTCMFANRGNENENERRAESIAGWKLWKTRHDSNSPTASNPAAREHCLLIYYKVSWRLQCPKIKDNWAVINVQEIHQRTNLPHSHRLQFEGWLLSTLHHQPFTLSMLCWIMMLFILYQGGRQLWDILFMQA